MKFGMGSSAGGSLFPTIIGYSGLTEVEIPEVDFHVIPISELIINEHLDITNKNPDYVGTRR